MNFKQLKMLTYRGFKTKNIANIIDHVHGIQCYLCILSGLMLLDKPGKGHVLQLVTNEADLVLRIQKVL